MSSQPLSPTKKLFLFLLPLLALAIWKFGQPTQATASASASAADSYTSGSKETKDGKTCCEKPPNRASLLKQAAPTPANSPAPVPSAPAP